MNGGGGNDVFYGQDGADVIQGRLGNDAIYGGNQNDTLYGGDNNDTLAGGNGRDFGYLGNGNDHWIDNAQAAFGDDFISGGAGNDTIQMFGGNDTALGGNGADSFEFRGTAFGNDVIRDYELGVDDISIDAALRPVNQAALDAMSDVSGGNLVLTFNANSILTLEGLTSNDGLLADLM